MKDLKFKAKDINDKWVYGFYHRLYDIDMECFHDYIIDYDGVDTPVDGDTVCRFTGELDRNGHEIYEHDIVHCSSLIMRMIMIRVMKSFMMNISFGLNVKTVNVGGRNIITQTMLL